ncbi:DNA-binding PadR family transcriptional regulator [Arthrobacter stackebrandtii]|uniref:DNA-binding PadR family transcriptional regulator n=1 Tax=Arthrobacter stackebrandtii TaxID=272161 RepID=A0ABS4YYE0_9MICC|nr:PadR family transcriptional regulator [Arthrobacter stackebrandtii]MBP2413816.1 DNA-binding PadR family transcriptional regulator [Arthrobacter stackebrandtii]PYH00395.1 PadR family transcriptional regulator [Arthrobacter stackebrandtii]
MPPVFAHGALRLYLLAVLEQGPQHGYEIIRALTDRFGGTYSPSAGTVYPRLAKLQEEGLLETTMDGRRTIYSLTDAGRAELELRQNELKEVQANITSSVRRLADEIRNEVQDNMRTLRAELAASAETARTAARQAPAAPRSQPAGTGAPLQQAEFLLKQFRDELRVELRVQSAKNKLDENALAAFQAALDHATAAVKGAFKA